MIGAAIMSTTFDNSLVAPDYYAKDIAYQTTMIRQQNSVQLAQPLRMEQEASELTLYFPTAEVGNELSGSVQLYSPVSSERDKNWKLRPDTNGQQLLSLKGLTAGRYRLIVTWNNGQHKFLDEFTVYVKA
jgi:hypothetical protein